MLSDEILNFLRDDARERFLKYVLIDTTSDEKNETSPSTERQWDLLRLLEKEMKEIGLADVELDEHGLVYGTLPAMNGVNSPAFGLLAHVDTSPDQPGDKVKPQIHRNWDGSPITFPEDSKMTLTVDDCPELRHFVGETIITASGRTLLGADNKAGVAEIMASMAAFLKFTELPHGEIRVCFTPDEEIGRGTVKINLDKLPKFCYTLDGGYPGELEDENFDAWRADIKFKGIGVHPGYAKDKMINAAAVCARFIAAFPEWQTPERTEHREGFYHVISVKGDFENAQIYMIIRDFEEENNQVRIDYLKSLISTFEKRYPGLEITLDLTHQYQNMRDIVRETPEVVDLAHKAIEDAGLAVIRKSIRGGTDGARLSQLGHPTPNVFAGGLMFHSRREWIAESSLMKGAETVIHLARYWSERKS